MLRKTLIGITVFAGFNSKDVARQTRYPMSLSFDPGVDVILNADSMSDLSPTGVRIVNDKEASIGKAIEFSSGANKRVDPKPKVYLDMHFSAPAGRYFVWLRGKSDVDNELTDSIWLQVDNQIGTQQGSVHLGNWNSFYPVGVYAWASDVHISNYVASPSIPLRSLGISFFAKDIQYFHRKQEVIDLLNGFKDWTDSIIIIG